MNEHYFASLRQEVADIKKMLEHQIKLSDELLSQVKALSAKQVKVKESAK